MVRNGVALIAGIVGLSFTPLALAVTQSFVTPGAHSFTVPAGVTSIQVEVAGAGGGAGSGVTVPNEFGVPLSLVGVYTGGSGGAGARVSATIAVAPGDVINLTVADSGKGGTLHTATAPAGTGAGGAGSGSGGSTANADDPADDSASLTGGGGGGASALSVSGTFIRAGGGGGGGGAHRNQSTFSSAESGAPGMSPAVSTADCALPGDGLPGTASPYVISSGIYHRTGSGGGGGGGYASQVGAGGLTPGLIFGGPFPVVEFAPEGGGGGGSCVFVGGAKALSNLSTDILGGAGGIADPAPISVWDATPGNEPAPIDGSAGWIRINVPDAPVLSAPKAVPSLGIASLLTLSSLLLTIGAFRRRKSQPD
ncbi:hypothetical protein [Ottowia thiooxydans]|uniref:IPTL-CTERM protein sorting domain-containing protein n=1 Tax=Ottowia thiooxydans TaxID=219182 RepID=A0ABV2Q9A6_9BURK